MEAMRQPWASTEVPPQELTAALNVTVPAHAERVRDLREASRALAVVAGSAHPEDVALAVSEALANVVRHAYDDEGAGPMHLQGWCDTTGLHVVVEDEGSGPTANKGEPGDVHLGLLIMARLAEHFMIAHRDGGGTRVLLDFDEQWTRV